jgi:pimeloyl-ACP methyl ester carboxylesterase
MERRLIRSRSSTYRAANGKKEEATMQQSYTLAEDTFPVAEGLSIYYYDFQPKTASGLTPIVYLPGLMRTARDFNRVAPRFADERRVVTIDTRGRGRAVRAEDPAAYEFDAMIDDVWSLLDYLRIDRMVMVGVALGTFMAWRMGAQLPDRVRGIVANDTGTQTVNKAGKKMVALADQGEYPFDQALEKLRESNQKNFPDFGLDDWREYTELVYIEVSPGKWKRDFHPSILVAWQATKEVLPSLWDDYARLQQIPVTILRGANSEFLLQEQADHMAAALSHGRTINIQGRGHPLRLDEPASLAAIRDVLAHADASRVNKE